jgi:mRNA interferase MazF
VLLSGDEVSGAALADQVKNLDWRSRQAQYKGKIGIAEIQEIKVKLAALLTLV